MHRPITAVILTACLCLGAVACGRDDGDTAQKPQPSAAVSTTATGTATSAPSATPDPRMELYNWEFAGLIDAFVSTTTRLAELLTAAAPEDPEWRSNVNAAIDKRKDAWRRVEGLEPPDCLRDAYQALREAGRLDVQSVELVRQAVAEPGTIDVAKLEQSTDLSPQINAFLDDAIAKMQAARCPGA